MNEITGRVKAAIADRYRIEREIGEGGMATVYLAHDVKHDRKVALKVLRPELAAVIGAERFLQEIKVTANLQHPHILPLHDSGQIDTFLYYVMPYVEGDTLRDKLDREKQLGIDDAIEITRNVASALDYAHRQNVIHRDIKPENILLHDGQALIADFGIALAVSEASGNRLTETGLSLGTPHYMSPEQAMGDRELDARSDIYSLGAMLYEMLAGDPPYQGSTAQAIVAKVITEKAPPVTAIRDTVPSHVAAAIQKALSKLPADRFPSAAAFAEALVTPGAVPLTPTVEAGAAVPARRRDWRAIALATALVLMTGLAAWATWRPRPPQPVSRYSVLLPADQRIGGFFARIAITPDGSRLVYSSGSGQQTQLWVRERDDLEATPLAGTNGAFAPFVSPDGSRVGFFAGGALKAVSLRGGPPITLADTLVGGGGATWSPDGFVYAEAAGPNPLVRVLASAGTPEWFTRIDSANGEINHMFPVALPNGKGVLFRVGRGSTARESDIAVAETSTGTHRILVRGVYAVYARSGHLVYVTADGTLLAAPFDQDAMELTSEPTALVSNVGLRVLSQPDLAIADDGTLVYTSGGGGGVGGEPVWVDRDGGAEAVAPSWTSSAGALALSPTGTQLAVAILGDGESSIWVRQLSRGTVSKLTFESNNIRPVWTPDGRDIVFSSDRRGQLDLYVRRADGTAQTELLLDRPRVAQESRLTRDGAWLVYREGGGPDSDLFARRTSGDTTPVPLAVTEFQETTPSVSPDGRWLAYASDETGQSEVYVRPFPDVTSGKWLVSSEGGSEPLWSRDGRELFYRNANNDMVAVEVSPERAPPTGQQRVLFSASSYVADVFHQMYDVTPDGERFVMLRVGGEQADDLQLIVVENFFEVLKSKVGW